MVPASAELIGRLVSERRTITVTVEKIDADFPGTAGVAAYDPLTGAMLDWLPIVGAARTAGRAEWTVAIPAGTLLCLTTDLELARHAYLHRIRAAAGQEAVTFDASLHATTLVVRLGDQLAPLGTLLRLEREDDPHWHMAIELGSSDSTDATGKLHWRLPAGKFHVRPLPPADWSPVPLSAPASGEVPVNFARA